jgi:hypothetical protein
LSFNTLAISLKKGSCKIEGSSLGLAKRDRVSGKGGVVNKKAYKL